MIRDVFFTGPTSFVMRHKDRFPTYIATGDVIQEVPKAMVALVATAVRFPASSFMLLADHSRKISSSLWLSRSGPAADINTRTFQLIQIWTPTRDTSILLTRSRPHGKDSITG